MRAEVRLEPRVELGGERLPVVRQLLLAFIHDFADLIEQGLVIALVLRICGIAPRLHVLLLEREVRRYLRVDLAEHRAHLRGRWRFDRAPRAPS